MTRTLLVLLVLLGLVACAARVEAATLYLKTCAAGCTWSDASSWSTTGSAGVDNSGPPADADTCILEAGSGNVTMAVSLSNRCGSVSMTAGTGDYAGTFTMAVSALTLVGTGTLWQASTAATVNIAASTILLLLPVADSSVVFAGGGKTYGRVYYQGTGTVDALAMTGSNTIDTFRLQSSVATTMTVTFSSGSTTTLGDFITLPTGGGTFAIVASTPMTPYTLTKSSGVVNVAAMTITDSLATGGATWCDGVGGVDGGRNTGWVFTACPIIPQQLILGVQ